MSKKFIPVFIVFLMTAIAVIYKLNDICVLQGEKQNNQKATTQSVQVIRYDTLSKEKTKIGYEDQRKEADYVVDGIIENVNYAFIDGIVWTRLTINKKQEIKGHSDQVVIYLLGGNVSASEYNGYYETDIKSEYVRLIDTQNNLYYEKGQEIVAFLTQTINESPFENKAFEGIYGNESVYIINNGECFVYTNEDEKVYK